MSTETKVVTRSAAANKAIGQAFSLIEDDLMDNQQAYTWLANRLKQQEKDAGNS